jgi:bifunctional NMN adenylyltransferase/nudix hydrolase
MGDITLYGSRDSFIDHYSGKFETCMLAPIDDIIPATEIRKAIGGETLDTKDFRHGVIYSTQNRYPKMYFCVDIAMIKGASMKDYEIILGTKYGDGKLRLVGGFCDQHETLESTCKREMHEESNLWIEGGLQYIGSYAIDDWRYRNSEDKIVSTFFLTEYTFGSPFSNDDLDDVSWHKLKDIKLKDMCDSHKPMIKDLLLYLKLKEIKR